MTMKKLDFESLWNFLDDAEDERFFGEIIFKYREGAIYQIVKSQSMKPEDITNDNRK